MRGAIPPLPQNVFMAWCKGTILPYLYKGIVYLMLQNVALSFILHTETHIFYRENTVNTLQYASQFADRNWFSVFPHAKMHFLHFMYLLSQICVKVFKLCFGVNDNSSFSLDNIFSFEHFLLF